MHLSDVIFIWWFQVFLIIDMLQIFCPCAAVSCPFVTIFHTSATISRPTATLFFTNFLQISEDFVICRHFCPIASFFHPTATIFSQIATIYSGSIYKCYCKIMRPRCNWLWLLQEINANTQVTIALSVDKGWIVIWIYIGNMHHQKCWINWVQISSKYAKIWLSK